MRQCDTPDWDPLRVFLCGDFMWMHDVQLDDGTLLNAYKHRITRRYLHLAEDGRAFVYTGNDRYQEVDADLATEEVFVVRRPPFDPPDFYPPDFEPHDSDSPDAPF